MGICPRLVDRKREFYSGRIVMYYASAGILAIVIHVIINFDVLRNSKCGMSSSVKCKYRRYLWMVLVYYAVDASWGFLYDLRIVPLAYVATVLFFFTMVLTLFLWMRFIVAFLGNINAFGKALHFMGICVLVIETGALIVNFFAPYVFKFEENGDYVPGQLRYITLSMQVMLFALLSLHTFYVAHKETGKNHLHYLAVGISGVFMTLFIILQAFYPFLPFYAIGCLINACIIHTFVVADERNDHSRELGKAMQKAYKDGLTRVQNRMAFLEMKDELDELIRNGQITSFGIIVFDINNLKKVNDTLGHETGDAYIKAASTLMSDCFVHSPVYRIGGDEFAILLRGNDLVNHENLLESFEAQNEINRRNGYVVVSSGLAFFDADNDISFDCVFERADRKMYERKKQLKAM